MDIDVENLVGRRADQRWNRVSFGDLFERNTWARPSEQMREALSAWGFPQNSVESFIESGAVVEQEPPRSGESSSDR